MKFVMKNRQRCNTSFINEMVRTRNTQIVFKISRNNPIFPTHIPDIRNAHKFPKSSKHFKHNLPQTEKNSQGDPRVT